MTTKRIVACRRQDGTTGPKYVLTLAHLYLSAVHTVRQ